MRGCRQLTGRPYGRTPLFLAITIACFALGSYARCEEKPDLSRVQWLDLSPTLPPQPPVSDPKFREWGKVAIVCMLFRVSHQPEVVKGMHRVAAVDIGSEEGKIVRPVLRQIRQMKNLQVLDLRGTDMGDAGLAELTRLHRLEALDLGGTRITDEGLVVIGKMSHLKWLNLSRTAVSDAGLANLRNLKQLEFLDLCDSQVIADGPAHIEGLPLKTLGWNGSATDKGLESLKTFKQLRKLTLSRCEGVTSAGVKSLLHLPMLEHLDVGATEVDDAGMRYVRQMRELRELDVGCTRLTDFGVRFLAGHPTLESFSVSPGLGRERITGNCISSLASLPKLRRLYLSLHMSIWDDQLQHLARFPALGHLTIASAEIKSDQLKHFAGLTKLESLSLYHNPIGDEGLVHLRRLTRLRKLYLGRTKVTQRGVDDLQRELPNLVIGWDGEKRNEPGATPKDSTETKNP